ncbi:hypothetical protein [Nitrosomonas sp. Nm166]|uniref:hypothetical protein n=1 Tax=Nitrosomonas sp. Nm166 TaxID=1881054 RepID=UPI0008E872C3|nr:hypothetical protein [Nitrosomonas sp. Nm166]SFF29943.1 hypothetical protein SAMN05428977_11162 [Nitrosomonas sp. Nm166]
MEKILQVYVTGILVLFFLHNSIAIAGSNEDRRDKNQNESDVLSQPKKESIDKRNQEPSDKTGARLERDRQSEAISGSGSGPLGTGPGSSSGTNPSGTAPAAGSSDSGTGPAYQGRRKSAE